jgi:hypothetical protein
VGRDGPPTAFGLGSAGAVVYPFIMSAWDELKPVLVRLRDEDPCTLTAWPMPESDENREPPFAIGLAPWADATANELHRQFGDDVELTVGVFAYPPGSRPEGAHDAGEQAEPLDSREMAAELEGPAVVRSGHMLRHGLLLRNRTDQEIAIATNGQVTAEVVDPQTGEVVGGYSGPQQARMVVFRLEPGLTERVPLLISTASFTPRLGYAVPAGDWGIQVTLALGSHPTDSPRRRTPVMPLTITA